MHFSGKRKEVVGGKEGFARDVGKKEQGKAKGRVKSGKKRESEGKKKEGRWESWGRESSLKKKGGGLAPAFVGIYPCPRSFTSYETRDSDSPAPATSHLASSIALPPTTQQRVHSSSHTHTPLAEERSPG